VLAVFTPLQGPVHWKIVEPQSLRAKNATVSATLWTSRRIGVAATSSGIPSAVTSSLAMAPSTRARRDEVGDVAHEPVPGRLSGPSETVPGTTTFVVRKAARSLPPNQLSERSRARSHADRFHRLGGPVARQR
jgi:hypothetical protein